MLTVIETSFATWHAAWPKQGVLFGGALEVLKHVNRSETGHHVQGIAIMFPHWNPMTDGGAACWNCSNQLLAFALIARTALGQICKPPPGRS